MSANATTALTYNGYIVALSGLGVYQYTLTSGVNVPNDAVLAALIPQALNYAELRIQRDLDLLPSLTSSSAYVMTTGSNTVALLPSDFVTVLTVSYLTGTASTPVLPTSKEFIQAVYNDSSFTGPPAYFAMYGGDQSTGGLTSNILLFGPYPDQSYPLLITGTQRLTTLASYATTANASTSTTFISTYYPDMLLQASMVFISQYQRNFAGTGNSPEMPGSFENQYQALLKQALEEENRKKLRGPAWTANSPAPVATPGR